MEDSRRAVDESKTLRRAENYLRGRLRGHFLRRHKHCSVPGNTLNSSSCLDYWDPENVLSLCQDFPYHCDLPKPLLPPAKLPPCVFYDEDPVLQPLTVKKRINDDIQRLLVNFERHGKNLSVIQKIRAKWNKENGRKCTTLPRHVADIAELCHLDPDPEFSGKYNWYHSRGSFNGLQLGGQNILVFPYAKEIVAAPIVPMKNLIWKPNLKNASKCKLAEDIPYELRYSLTNRSCSIASRFKNRITFNLLTENNYKMQLTEFDEISSTENYISMDFKQDASNQFCTLDTKRGLTLWDLTKRKSLASGTITAEATLEDSWGSIQFLLDDPNVLTFTDRCCLHYLDIRDRLDRVSLTLCPKSDLEVCENLSLSLPSRNNFCRYVASYHSLLTCDKRSPKECVAQKWMHLYKSPPIFGNVFNRNEEEIVVLSSQLSGENSIILNNWSNMEIPCSHNLPYKQPNILNSLFEVQVQGKCLDPLMKKRLELCNTGSALILNDDGNVSFFTQNSAGDIFYQCITHEQILDKYSLENCQTYYALAEWEKAMEKQRNSVVPLTISQRNDMEHIFQSFTNRKLNPKAERTCSIDESYLEVKWQQSLEKLNSYQDILASELLAAWEVAEALSTENNSQTEPVDKVLNWLEAAKDSAPPASQEIEALDLTGISSQELFSVSQQQQQQAERADEILYLDDSTAIQELFLPKVSSQSQNFQDKKKKKKSKFFVPGF